MAKPGTFKPGQSGNPNGAPKRSWTWSGELQKAVEKKYKDGTPVKEAVANSLITQAVGGNVLAAKELMNRMDGMPDQPIKHEGDLNVNIHIDEALKKKE